MVVGTMDMLGYRSPGLVMPRLRNLERCLKKGMYLDGQEKYAGAAIQSDESSWPPNIPVAYPPEIIRQKGGRIGDKLLQQMQSPRAGPLFGETIL